MGALQIKPLLNLLYQGVDGYNISWNAREKKRLTNLPSFTYGEIDYDTFETILHLVDPKPKEVFYDLGCGVGKPVFEAALLEPFSKCVGIEIIPELYNQCLIIQKRFNTIIKPLLSQENIPNISFIKGDFMKQSFSKVDVIYSSTTCFLQETLQNLTTKIESEMKKGSRIITLRPLESDNLYLLWTSFKKMSWGEASVYVYKIM